MTESQTPHISRRQIAGGIAWSAPAILMAANAPAFAASLMCVTLATSFSSGWTYQNPASGTLLTPASNRVVTGTDGVQYYLAQTTATSTTAAVVRATGTFTAQTSAGTGTLRAGCSYSMSYGLGAIPNSQGTAGHQVLTVKLVDPNGVVVPGSQKTYTTATGQAGQINVPYATGGIRKTLDAQSFTFKAVAGTYSVVAEFTTPTKYNNSAIYATGLGFSSPKFTAV